MEKRLFNGITSILVRDLKRLVNDKVRLVAGLMQPLLYLFVLGSGLGPVTILGAGYIGFIFPGIIALSLLLTASISGISIVHDREMGFLKAVLVAPVSRTEIAIGKILSGSIQAMIQGCLIIIFAMFTKVKPVFPQAFLFPLAMFYCALIFSAMGVAIATRFKSAEVFPIFLNAILLPMFFISGAMFPIGLSPAWIKTLSKIDPVSYAVDLLRGILLDKHYFGSLISFSVLTVLLVLFTIFAVKGFEKADDL